MNRMSFKDLDDTFEDALADSVVVKKECFLKDGTSNLRREGNRDGCQSISYT